MEHPTKNQLYLCNYYYLSIKLYISHLGKKTTFKYVLYAYYKCNFLNEDLEIRAKGQNSHYVAIFNLYKTTWCAQHLRSLILLWGKKKITKRPICSNAKTEVLRGYRYWNNKTQILIQIKCNEGNLFAIHIFVKQVITHFCVYQNQNTNSLKGVKYSSKGCCTLLNTKVYPFFRNLNQQTWIHH